MWVLTKIDFKCDLSYAKRFFGKFVTYSQLLLSSWNIYANATSHMVQFSASCLKAYIMIDEKTLISPPPDQALHEVELALEGDAKGTKWSN